MNAVYRVYGPDDFFLETESQPEAYRTARALASRSGQAVSVSMWWQGQPIFQAFSTGVVKKNLVIKYYKYYQISGDIFGEYTVINYLNITLIRANIHTTKGKDGV